jgi:starch synthase
MRPAMRAALGVASECAPLVKTGGLADVVGALPAALRPHGWHLRSLLPGYPALLARLPDTQVVAREDDLFGGPARLLSAQAHGLDLLVLDAPHLYDRAGSPYLDADGQDWPDNDRRFAALGWMAARIATGALPDWQPEVLHLHDWQAGLAAVYCHQMGAQAGRLMTIHNIAFHGLTGAGRRAALRLPEGGFTPEGFEYYGQISALKAGLIWSDRISTVSPTYACELTTPEFGMGLDGVIRARADALSGILNGVDLEVWNPATDPAIQKYSTPRGKAANRARLAAEFGVEPGDGPLCAVISRLSEQKGLDLLLGALPRLLDRGGSLVLLGSGDRALETAWRRAADQFDRVGVRIGYDEGLSHRMYAGADAVLVPSRFEPCGLTQLYALRYGAIPLVALTGGLADTVIPANEAGLRAGAATGVQFHPVTAQGLGFALDRLCTLHADRKAWGRMQRNAMRAEVGWDASARQYAALYEGLAANG